MLDFTGIAVLDNHCHLPLHEPPPRTSAGLARFFSQTSDPVMLAEHVPNSLFFRRAIRDLASLLGWPDEADQAPDPAEVLARRAEYSAREWFRLVVERTNLDGLLADTGYPRSGAWTVEEAQSALETLPRAIVVRPIFRLERMLEDLIPSCDIFAQCEEAWRVSIRSARDRGAVALKSILAYRSGLAVRPDDTGTTPARAAFGRLKAESRRTGQPPRVADKSLLDYMIAIALEEAGRVGLPVQFHTGFGDTDGDLALANPALLRPFLENPRLQAAPVVLLHCYPYIQEAAYLASVYPQVYLDISLASPLVAYGGGPALEDALGLAPTSKILYGSDARGIPDGIYLGALHSRRRLAQILSRWISDGWLNAGEADKVGGQILAGNARRLYQL